MLDKLYITPRQWLHILRWSLYCLLFLLAMMTQTVVLGNRPIFGITPDFIPIVITCVCVKEGPQKGGWFALLTSFVWFLSGADYGSVSIAILTVLPVMGSVICRGVLNSRFLPCLLVNFLTLFLLHSIIFFLKFLINDMDGALFVQKLLPCVLISMIAQPIVYLLVKKIHQIGDNYEPA